MLSFNLREIFPSQRIVYPKVSFSLLKIPHLLWKSLFEFTVIWSRLLLFQAHLKVQKVPFCEWILTRIEFEPEDQALFEIFVLSVSTLPFDLQVAYASPECPIRIRFESSPRNLSLTWIIILNLHTNSLYHWWSYPFDWVAQAIDFYNLRTDLHYLLCFNSKHPITSQAPSLNFQAPRSSFLFNRYHFLKFRFCYSQCSAFHSNLSITTHTQLYDLNTLTTFIKSLTLSTPAHSEAYYSNLSNYSFPSHKPLSSFEQISKLNLFHSALIADLFIHCQTVFSTIVVHSKPQLICTAYLPVTFSF